MNKKFVTGIFILVFVLTTIFSSNVINTCKKDTRQHYIPVEKLTYATRLKQMLKEELGLQGKPKVLDLLVCEIETITNECYVDEHQVGLGQIRVMVPSVIYFMLP